MKLLICFLFLILQCWFVTCERSLKSFRFQAHDLSPESFDYDRVRDRFLLGSQFHGTVSELASDGSLREFLRDAEYAGKAGIAGVKVDSRRNRVIVAVADTVGWLYGGVAAYDLDSRERVFFASLEGVGVAEGERFRANDIALNFRTGDVYVTNSIGNFLWKVTPEGTPSVFLKNESFTSQPALLNNNFKAVGLAGIVYTPSKFLLAIQTNSGALFRIGVEDQSVHRVLLSDNHTFPTADGMALREDGTLVVVSPERLWLVWSARHWTAASVVDTLAVNATAAAAVRRRATFVLRSQMDEFEVSEVVFPEEEAESDPVWLVVLVVAVVVMVSLWRFQMGHFYEQYRHKRD